MSLSCFWRGPSALGEGPMWHPIERCLYFIDITEKSLHRLDIHTMTHQTWLMPDYLGAVLPSVQTDTVIITMGRGVYRFNTKNAKLTLVTELIPKNKPEWRMNDAKCDALGRLWIGVAHATTENPTGGLWCLDLDGSLTQRESGISISNGLGFSPDHKTFYYTDGLRYRVYAYDFDLPTGQISNRRIFIQYPFSPAEPDGLTVDSAGDIWQAVWESGRLYRYAPDGRCLQVVDMPVARPTSCMIGGDDYRQLFITSCSLSLGETSVLPEPAGAIFVYDLVTPGMPEPLCRV